MIWRSWDKCKTYMIYNNVLHVNFIFEITIMCFIQRILWHIKILTRNTWVISYWIKVQSPNIEQEK